MSIPIAYTRLKAVINLLGENQVGSKEKALELIKKKKYKTSFLVRNRETQKLELISDNAILGWFNVGRYWDIVEKESYQLTDDGKNIHEGVFSNQLQSHISMYIREKWDADFNTIWEAISKFSTDDGNWPTIDYWYEVVTEIHGYLIPKVRFKQMVYFMVGMNLVNREQKTLYTIIQ